MFDWIMGAGRQAEWFQNFQNRGNFSAGLANLDFREIVENLSVDMVERVQPIGLAVSGIALVSLCTNLVLLRQLQRYQQVHFEQAAVRRLEKDLRRAVERQEFKLCYQPIIALDEGRILGFEALIRWRHPQKGWISPEIFIPVAETSGLIVPIGYWVLREACRQTRLWQNQFPTQPPLSVSVNLSARQFAQQDLLEQIQHILQETQFDPNCLKLEITESALLGNAESAARMLQQLRTMGIKTLIDDFGTGYSSLSYLHRLPVDTLKIDRCFINQVDTDGDRLELVRTIINLAWNLGFDVIAEGVETNTQLSQLEALRCDAAQGYLFSQPIESNQVQFWLATQLT